MFGNFPNFLVFMQFLDHFQQFQAFSPISGFFPTFHSHAWVNYIKQAENSYTLKPILLLMIVYFHAKNETLFQNNWSLHAVLETVE